MQMPDDTATVKPVAIRAGTKQAQIIAMLQRPEGATVNEMVEAGAREVGKYLDAPAPNQIRYPKEWRAADLPEGPPGSRPFLPE